MARNEVDGYSVVGRIVAFIAFFPAIALQFVLGGVVLFKYWGWFVEPVLHPTWHPTILQLIGLQFFWRLFHKGWAIGRRKSDEEKKLEYGLWESIIMILIGMGFALLGGWVMHHYVITNDPRWLNEWLGM